MKRLSLLIPTLEERRDLFRSLKSELDRQILDAGAKDAVEIVVAEDNRETVVGEKRNALMDRARGEFLAFLDDDDEIAPDYISRVLGALDEMPDADCVGMRAQITFRGKHPRYFVASLRYRSIFEKGGSYYRPPYHLNPTRSEIARRYRFAHVKIYEDLERALRMSRTGALRREVFVEPVLYFYHSRRRFAYQRLLDVTQPVRQVLGLEGANFVHLPRGDESVHGPA
jgi:glycosyltransferase involved in cell wall biosynthesis